MTTLFKICIAIIGLLVVVGVLCGVYVWYTLQHLDAVTGESVPVVPVSRGVQETESSPKTMSPTTGVEESAPVTIDVSTLTPAQQKMLSAFGYDAKDLVISADTIACAEGELGVVRLNEIINGGAPNPLEAMKLAGCLKNTGP